MQKTYYRGHVEIDIDTEPTQKIQIVPETSREFSAVLGQMHAQLHTLTEFSDALIVDGFRLASKGRRIQWRDGNTYEIVDVFQDTRNPLLIIGRFQQR